MCLVDEVQVRAAHFRAAPTLPGLCPPPDLSLVLRHLAHQPAPQVLRAITDGAPAACQELRLEPDGTAGIADGPGASCAADLEAA